MGDYSFNNTKFMKRLPLLILFLFTITSQCLAQLKTYDAQWKKVDELINKKRLPKSALAEVKKIYALAKKEGQQAQVIKSLVYMTDLQEETREDNDIASIREWEKEISAAKEPAASIMKSILASIYRDYLQHNRYKFYDRTTTVAFNKNDIDTWSLQDLHQKIGQLFQASLQNKKLLQQTGLSAYDAIIIKGGLRTLRPTLYDLLAHRALEYFENDESDLVKPAYAFEINQPEAFSTPEKFITVSFQTKDSTSNLHDALLLYQDLIRFHLTDKNPDAMVDADIKRIEFVKRNYTGPQEDSLYVNALEALVTKYPANAIAKQASFLLASWHNERAQTYEPSKDTSYRYERIKAVAILEAAVKDSSIKSAGWVNSYNFLQQLKQAHFSFQVEGVNVPGTPFRALVTYQNVNTLHLRLVKMTAALKKQLESREEDQYWSTLMTTKAERTWSQALPNTNDLQEHKVEIKIDALPVGEYYLVASPNETYNAKTSLVGAGHFHVSNISYVSQEDHFFVLHRETGLPLVNAQVEAYKNVYDYNTSKYIRTTAGNYKTDINGYFKLAPNKEERYNNYFFDIKHQQDQLNLEEAYYRYYSNFEEAPRQTIQTFFFTDRSIYRPGQTVYFKGIIVSRDKNYSAVVPNNQTVISLYDANGEKKDSLVLTSNEFGSINGQFRLPEGLLNGTFQVRDKERGVAYISVEEYKRAKFYVEFEKVKDSYKVNDTVTVSGLAKAYAGNNIDNAKVNYRVVRKPRFIYRWFSRSWLPQVEEMEIVNGTTTTDATGAFTIRFKAIPDNTLDKKYDPLFDYHVYADITDINGETRSSSKVVTAGYKSVVMQLVTPERISVDSLKQLFIRTENMNGEYQPSTITVQFHQLTPEQRLIRERLWETPDQFVMTKEEYIRHFPYDEYHNETDPATWNKTLAFTKTDTTHTDGSWIIGRQNLKAGMYEITVTTKDAQGNEVTDKRFIELFDRTAGFIKPEYLWTKGSNPIEPGESTTIEIGTSVQQVFLVSQVAKKTQQGFTEVPIGQKGKQPIPVLEHNEVNEGFRFTILNNEKRPFTFTATEADRGGYSSSFVFVKHNRFYKYSDMIVVPWSNKELKVEYETFRDKTLPGSEEKWKVKITGYKNEQVAAEMLVSMYDASLDQFKPHQWNKPGLWPMNYRMPAWSADANFRAIESQEKYLNVSYKEFSKTYDRLNYPTYLKYPIVTVAYGTKRKRASNEREERISSAAPVVQMDMAVRAESKQMMSADTVSNSEFYVEFEDRVNTSNDPAIQVRKNFNETAFFFPELRTDPNGAIEFTFTAPEALTRWKVQALAHTKGLAFGLAQKELVTQKELMVQPNMPRFVRQGDRMEMSAKIVNLSDKEITGQAQLLLFDATTNQSVDGYFINTFPNQYFTVAPGQSELVKFPIQVPFQFSNTLTWRIVARSEQLSDGEENFLPVLSNKILVTETLALPLRGNETKNFSFDKLLKSGESETLQHHALAVEYTSNPAWYAVQALPYLMEYPYDCAEQTWNRYYANALASHITNASPKLRQVFEKWKNTDTAALLSALQKNEEFKSAILEETPWVLAAKTETEQKKNIAILFDMVRMSTELSSSLEKLKQMQTSGGSFTWFKGGPEDRYITQYIVTGMGRLKKLGLQSENFASIYKPAIAYLDRKITQDYKNLVKSKAKLTTQPSGDIQVQYLYMRSFFPELPVPASAKTAYNHYRNQAKKFWMQQGKSTQAMTALVLSRTADKITPAAILKSLKETSILHEELGRYWKDNQFGLSWRWSQAPIETQSLMVEAFNEISKDITTVDELRTWLIKNKQTNNWRTTKATADACYAMLLQGTNWLDHAPVVQIQLGTTTINSNSDAEAGTGYFKQNIPVERIQPAMGNISVKVSGNENTPTASSWGAVYWQYFEDMDKVTTASTPLKLEKKLFIEKNSDRGPVLTPVTDGMSLQVGDKITVRIELRVDRDMEYVHMKDLRASALEPVNVLSGYKWQGGLGYYESTRDASTNFFFNQLRKGSYVFEYSLFVTHTGNFSNGITTIQCMYAPEFSAHSEGVRISIE